MKRYKWKLTDAGIILSSQQIEQLFAPGPEDGPAARKYLEAAKRLAFNEPIILKKGSPVNRINVAKEAGNHPTALKPDRYPGVIRKIEAYLELTKGEDNKRRAIGAKVKEGKLNLKEEVAMLKTQLSESQSKLLSVERKLLESLQDIADLQAELDELKPPPSSLRS
ncbi:hypothetical protein [Herbaspirillum huttiense]|uniref:hypothetical protein n=1 Tax=Herbaspirillum huttiense TaxID=863372 RepID=UPI003B39FC3A